ncbi:hypothetical protein HAX54_042413, partial [Datura stramonium]|nr:hypothetical protein [Datura stramonium]
VLLKLVMTTTDGPSETLQAVTVNHQDEIKKWMFWISSMAKLTSCQMSDEPSIILSKVVTKTWNLDKSDGTSSL